MLTTIGIIAILAGIKCFHILESKTLTLTLASKGDATFMSSFKEVADCISPSSKGDNTDLDTDHTLWRTLNGILNTPLALFMALQLCLEKINTQIYFDTDSVFFCLQKFNHWAHL